MKKVTGNQALVRTTNQNLIIEKVRKSGPISRAELAKLLGLSAPSISSNIDSLLKKNILKEIGEGESQGGRKPILLDFNYDFGYIVAVDLSGDEFRVALGNLNCDILGIKSYTDESFSKGVIKKSAINGIVTMISSLLEEKGISKEKVMTICIGTPGVIDRETGNFMLAPRFEEWQSINMEAIIRNEFNTDLIIKNDINLAALGEKIFGAGRGFGNLVYISVDIGLGAGLVINDEVYEGKRMAAGDIGYLISSLEELRTKSHESTILHSKASTLAFVQKAKEGLKRGENSKLLQLVNGNIDKVNFDSIKKAVKEGDEYCIKLTGEISEALAWAIANMSILLDLELVIIGGPITDLGYHFIQPLRSVVNRLIPLSTTVVFSELGQRSAIYGAFATALDYVLNDIAK